MYVHSMIIEINAVHSFTEINLLSITFNCDIMTSHFFKQQFIVKIFGNIRSLRTAKNIFLRQFAIRLYLIVGFFLFFFFYVQDTKRVVTFCIVDTRYRRHSTILLSKNAKYVAEEKDSEERIRRGRRKRRRRKRKK